MVWACAPASRRGHGLPARLSVSARVRPCVAMHPSHEGCACVCLFSGSGFRSLSFRGLATQLFFFRSEDFSLTPQVRNTGATRRQENENRTERPNRTDRPRHHRRPDQRRTDPHRSRHGPNLRYAPHRTPTGPGPSPGTSPSDPLTAHRPRVPRPRLNFRFTRAVSLYV
jgi:hypothetical protein